MNIEFLPLQTGNMIHLYGICILVIQYDLKTNNRHLAQNLLIY